MDLQHCIGLGVAGNFAKHLEQAGEIRDFLQVEAEEGAPKGIFPFYLPNSDSFLHCFPLSSDKQVVPDHGNPQAEPEIALYCELIYQDNKVVDIRPLKFAAFNDCSIRKEGAKKISEKKNWGPCSKGVSNQWIDLDSFSRGGVLDGYRLASFLERDGELHAYGVDTEVLGYSYFYEKLITWLIDRINHQQDTGPLENIHALLAANDWPSHAIISVGATAYEPFGETHFLQSGDRITMVAYPQSLSDIEARVKAGVFPADVSVLQQRVE